MGFPGIISPYLSYNPLCTNYWIQGSRRFASTNTFTPRITTRTSRGAVFLQILKDSKDHQLPESRKSQHRNLTANQPLKNDGWKTIGTVCFQGPAVKLQVGFWQRLNFKCWNAPFTWVVHILEIHYINKQEMIGNLPSQPGQSS